MSIGKRKKSKLFFALRHLADANESSAGATYVYTRGADRAPAAAAAARGARTFVACRRGCSSHRATAGQQQQPCRAGRAAAADARSRSSKLTPAAEDDDDACRSRSSRSSRSSRRSRSSRSSATARGLACPPGLSAAAADGPEAADEAEAAEASAQRRGLLAPLDSKRHLRLSCTFPLHHLADVG